MQGLGKLWRRKGNVATYLEQDVAIVNAAGRELFVRLIILK